MPDLKVGEVEEVLEGLYTQKEEIKVSKVMHKVLLQSEQVVVKPNILDLDDYDVKMEPKATQSDEDIINELCGDQSLYQDDQLDDGHDDIELDLDDLKEEPSKGEEKKKKRGRPRKKIELGSSDEDEWEEYSEKKPPKKRKVTPRKKKDDDGDDDEDDDDEEGGRRSWGTTSSRCCKCCRPVAGHPLPRHSKYRHLYPHYHSHHSHHTIQITALDVPFTNFNMSSHFSPILMTFLARCQLEGVDEAGMKEREVELEKRRVRRKEREDMYRCQNPDSQFYRDLEIVVTKAF